MPDTLYIVVPCYNEEEVLPETAARLTGKLESLRQRGKVSPESRLLLVDDGSRDQTWAVISRLAGESCWVSGVKLTRNRGHQNALLAGLMTAKERCDFAISMDADLQDDVDAVDRMVEEYYGGSEIVYGVRSSRRKDTRFKRGTAQGYYRLMHLMGVELVYNHADYRLMSRRALEGLAEYKEVHLFLRGIVPLIGYRSSIVEYERGERFAGESKYPLKKMLALAFEGVTSFSVKPIRLITLLGFVIILCSVAALVYTLVSKWFSFTVEGWTSLMCSIWFLGGVQLLALGIIGEYIGKIYFETKARPKYRVEEIVDPQKKPD